MTGTGDAATRSCVVTGATGGIGSAIVRTLRAEGWHVVGIDVHAPGDPSEPAVVGDVSDRSVHERAAELASSVAPLRGWVNAAGRNYHGTVADMPDAELRECLETNLVGVFLGTGAAIRHHLAAPGSAGLSVVNISSIQASAGFLGFAAYAAAKGGIEALTRQVAAEFVTRSIRCNAIAPGLISTPMNDQLLAESDDPEAILGPWRDITPMGRWGRPHEVADAVEFLLSERSSYVTGEVLAVNGGALAVAAGQRPG